MATYIGDQPAVCAVVVEGSALTTSDASELKLRAVPGDGTAVYVFSANYTTVWHGATLGFRAAMGYQLDAALLAFLTASGAPMTAV